jgi:hypothetical protein
MGILPKEINGSMAVWHIKQRLIFLSSHGCRQPLVPKDKMISHLNRSGIGFPQLCPFRVDKQCLPQAFQDIRHMEILKIVCLSLEVLVVSSAIPGLIETPLVN